MSAPTVTKSQVDLYNIRGLHGAWANIVVIPRGDYVELIIDSDFGAFAYAYFCHGGNYKQFLISCDFDYLMRKFRGKDYKIPDPSKYEKEIKDAIIESRQGEQLTKDEAREAWNDMLNTEHDRGDLFFAELYDHKLFEKVFGDHEGLPSAKKVDPQCQSFWDKCWLPFVEELKQEMAAEPAK